MLRLQLRYTLFPYTTLFRSLKTYVEKTVPRMIGTAIVPVVIVLYIFTVDKISAVILIVTVPIIVIFMILLDRKSTRLNSSHVAISYAVFCLKKKNNNYDFLV